MSFIQRFTVPVTTDAGGDATAYTPNFTGKISQIRYVATDFTAGVDFTVTVEGTGENVWVELNVNASKTVAPRQATHDTAGVASLYAAAGEPVEDKIAVANDRVKIVVAAGGATKTGTFHVLVE